MTLGIIVPLIALPIVLVVFWRWYSTSIRGTSDTPAREISGVRLTAEALHRLSTLPLRVVYEIGDQLTGVDHVVIGAPGVVAIRTSASDRPTLQQLAAGRPDAAIVAESAVARGAVDDLMGGLRASCDLLAHVYWGAADPQRQAVESPMHATVYVEGQRLGEWLSDWVANAPATLDAGAVDATWRAISIGLGRPDPLA